MEDKIKSIYIIALAALGGGLSGGDRIFIEFARRWSKKIPTEIFVWEEGFQMCKRENLEGANLKISLVEVGFFSRLGFVVTYFYRTLLGIKLGFSLNLKDSDYIYSASEFWMDCLPAFIIKLRNPKINWIAAWYQTAPNPITGFTEGNRENTYKIRAFFYWLIQQTTKPLIFSNADFILVNNDLEKIHFGESNAKLITVLGAVKTEDISKYQKTHEQKSEKKYLAVFQGRFHPQKGVVEFIDIWRKVVDKLPNAKLAMIGDGPLMGDVKKGIKKLALEKNIELFGYLHDGEKKYDIFQKSKIVVHPAFYDSGGMAAAEAMAFGLPCVGFDLKSYESYYPKGMIKVNVGDQEAFANVIIEFNKNGSLYKKIAKDGLKMIKERWSWDTRTEQVLSLIMPKNSQ